MTYRLLDILVYLSKVLTVVGGVIGAVVKLRAATKSIAGFFKPGKTIVVSITTTEVFLWMMVLTLSITIACLGWRYEY